TNAPILCAASFRSLAGRSLIVVARLSRTLLLLALILLPLRFASATALSEADRQGYRQALQALRNSDFPRGYRKWVEAQAKVLAKAIRFFDLSRSGPGNRFADIAQFVNDNPGWPNQITLRQRAEEAMASASDAELAKWFERNPPVTQFGKLREAEI